MYSSEVHMAVATPPSVHQGFITVSPPVTLDPTSRTASFNMNSIPGH